jgi:hypothetical protein
MYSEKYSASAQRVLRDSSQEHPFPRSRLFLGDSSQEDTLPRTLFLGADFSWE